MPAYKVTYFNIKGLAEPMRYLLAYGNIDYEDVRVEKENWPALKSSKHDLRFTGFLDDVIRNAIMSFAISHLWG